MEYTMISEKKSKWPNKYYSEVCEEYQRINVKAYDISTFPRYKCTIT